MSRLDRAVTGMGQVFVSYLAVERYCECIGGTPAMAFKALSGPAVRCAADFGARVVRMERARALLKFGTNGAVVVTVVPLDRLPFQLIPETWGGPPPSRVDYALM